MIICFRGGTIVDPARNLVQEADLVVEAGRISRILPPGRLQGMSESTEIIDVQGKWVVPGLIDMHVHLREPGQEYKETVSTGARAAVAGGFSAVACMPNTEPPNDCRAVTEFILEQAERAGLCRVYPIAAITVGRKGEQLTEFGDLRKAGAVALSDDGACVRHSGLMRRALEYARYHGMSVISHCEDPSLSEGGVMHEGFVSTRIGLRGIPAASEEIVVCRDICLTRLTSCPVHIAHVSTAGAVEMIRRAKEEGLPVTAETAPHYFSLDHEAVDGYNTRAKVNPPLRTPEDVEAVRRGLAEGVIDAIASDHAPHDDLEKDVEFDRAAFGMIGLQTALPLTLALIREGVLSVPRAIRALSLAPAEILGVGGGRLQEGETADLTVIDPEAKYVFDEADILSKSRNSPFIGATFKGRCDMTMIGGRIVWRRADSGR